MTGAITLIVPYPAGGGTDQRARLLARHLSRELGVEVNAVNRPGAVAGHTAIAQAASDGTTIGIITGEIGMMHWHAGVTSLTWRDYTPLAAPFVEDCSVIVRADAPFASLAAWLHAVRARGTSGSGSPDFGIWKFGLLGLMRRAGIALDRLRWTPTTSGEEGVEKLVAGEVEVCPVGMTEARHFIFDGKARALATMSARRHPLFPDVPTVKEACGIDWVAAHWRGLVAPKGLPEPARARFAAALTRIERDAAFIETCRANGFSLDWHHGERFAAYMAADDEHFGGLIGEMH